MRMQDEGFAIGQDMLQRYPDITVFLVARMRLRWGPPAVKVANLGQSGGRRV
jgi:hypothetical protein